MVSLVGLPLQNTLGQYGSFGRMYKWVVQLAPYDISYQPRRTTKVADFIV